VEARQQLAAPEITNAGYEVFAGATQRPVQQAAGQQITDQQQFGQLPEWPRQALSNGSVPAPSVPSAQSQVYGGQPVITPGPATSRQAGPVNPNWQRLPPR
jgi:hypothetical protein